MPKKTKTIPRSDREVIQNIIEAWESLKGGRRYRPDEIESWIVNRMGRAIDEARQHLATNKGERSCESQKILGN